MQLGMTKAQRDALKAQLAVMKGLGRGMQLQPEDWVKVWLRASLCCCTALHLCVAALFCCTAWATTALTLQSC